MSERELEGFVDVGDALAAPYRVVRSDLRGFGRSAQAAIPEAGVANLRRVDVDTAHLPNLERAQWFTQTLLPFLAGIPR